MFETIVARLKEPSTWAGFAAALAGAGFMVPDSAWQLVAQGGMWLAALLAVIIGEKGQA